MKRIYISIFTVISALSVCAQGLNKEITIEKEIVPEQRAATRLDVSHAIISPQLKSEKLNISERELGLNTRPEEHHLLAPFEFERDAFNKGYATVGFLPGYNGYAAAGYNFLDLETLSGARNKLNAWIEYDGKSYKSDFGEFAEKARFADQNFNFGTRFTQNAEKHSFELGVGFGFNSVQRPNIYYREADANPEYFKQGNTRFSIGATYRGTVSDGIKYYINGKFGLHQNNTKDNSMPYGEFPVIENLKGTKELNYALYAGVTYNNYKLDISGDFLNYNHFNNAVYDVNTMAEWSLAIIPGGGKTTGIITATPGYLYKNDMFKVNIGLKAQYSVNSGDKFHIAPDIKLDATLNPYFAVDVTANGGVYQNSLGSLFNYSHYLNPLLAYGNYVKPYDVKAGITIGPKKGCFFRIYGGYAKFEDYLVSTMNSSSLLLTPMNVKDWYGGANLHVEYKNVVTFDAVYDYKPVEYKHELAKQAVKLYATVRPIEKLTINAGWDLVFGRKYSILQIDGNGEPTINPDQNTRLSDYNSVNIGAAYAFTKNISAFTQLRNILAHDNDITVGVLDQGFNGLVGVSLKF